MSAATEAATSHADKGATAMQPAPRQLQHASHRAEHETIGAEKRKKRKNKKKTKKKKKKKKILADLLDARVHSLEQIVSRALLGAQQGHGIGLGCRQGRV